MKKSLFLPCIALLLSFYTFGQESVTSYYGDQAVNVFIQPNLKNAGEFTLDYYGSGDANNDGIIDWDDYNLMVLGTSNDRTKVTGTGTNQEDINLLYDYLMDSIRYLPAHWNWLQDSTERIEWYEKTVIIDQPQTPIPGGDCSAYSLTHLVSESGVENIDSSGLNFNLIDTTENMRFNLPVNVVGCVTLNLVAHFINSIAIGDTLTSLYTHYLMEPQLGQRVFPGDISVSPNHMINIERLAYVYSEFLGDTIHGRINIIWFDLENGIVSDTTFLHPDAPLYRTLKNVHLQGQKPADVIVNWEGGQANTNPSNTGYPTGVSPSGTTMEWSDTTNQGTGNWNPDTYNYWIKRSWRLVQDTIIDTTLCHTWTVYNRPAQQITVQDTASPVFVYVPSGSILFTEYEANGIPDSQGNDNCGVFEITRTADSTNRVMDSTQCEYYEFTEWFSDHIEDPTGNFDDSSSFVNIELDPSIFNFVPPTYTANYGDPLDPLNTGGYATATNPAGVTVNISYSDSTTQLSDSTQCGHYTYELWRKWWAVTDPCQDSIWALQLISVQEIEPPILTYVPPDTVVPIGGNIHPDYLGWSEGEDPVSGVPPTPDYYDEVIYQGADSIYIGRHHWVEDICLTPSDEGMQYITQMVMIGNDELGNRKQFVVYPNPAFTKLIILLPANSTASRIEAYSLLGHKQLTIGIEPAQQKVILDVSSLPRGFYLLKVFAFDKLLGMEKVVLIDLN